jgi:hypothetical protein
MTDLQIILIAIACAVVAYGLLVLCDRVRR